MSGNLFVGPIPAAIAGFARLQKLCAGEWALRDAGVRRMLPPCCRYTETNCLAMPPPAVVSALCDKLGPSACTLGPQRKTC